MKTLNDISLKPGDIILYRGTTLLSKSIRFFMNLYRKRLGLPKRTIFNHAAMIVKVWDELYIAEANAKGIEVRPFIKAYGNKLDKIKIIKFKDALTIKEQNKISKEAVGYSLMPTRYDFLNFLFQIEMIIGSTNTKKGKWYGAKGKKAENRLYCSEAVAVWANSVRPNTFDDAWSINPLDIDLNENFDVVYNGID